MNRPAPARDPLAGLAVIRRLEVGPVRLEPNRLTCPYRVVTDRGAWATELIYRYQEKVFDPAEEASRNLAAVTAAQPALNYGLFCDEIVLAGPLDALDRRLLRDMARNTAREIYVKKFLEPNPFLVGPARGLPAVRRPSFLRARLVFPGPRPREIEARPWAAGRAAEAVLSSGGKESLLSFALLIEMGRQVHPIFINESGRHWFTALNAYRRLAVQAPLTARVWTNADRVFAWLLRRLPFVRPDFASLRSDEYPIRLWTMALLVFGALPLLRRRGVGRLVIGNEFDTTRRARFKGVAHYDGLFDQSAFFDRVMEAYFRAKGWGVSQFSIVRPLSELLVEKILVERYPELQGLQVSCHAAHKDGQSIRPCGRCEKCRRVVGLLLAAGGDPSRCGYDEAQIRRCLKDLAGRPVNQEAAAAQETLFLLRQKGLLDPAAGASAGIRPRPEALKLRFDPVRSPLEAVPPDLRRPLFTILLAHARGALRRSSRTWVEFDPLDEPAPAGEG